MPKLGAQRKKGAENPRHPSNSRQLVYLAAEAAGMAASAFLAVLAFFAFTTLAFLVFWAFGFEAASAGAMAAAELSAAFGAAGAWANDAAATVEMTAAAMRVLILIMGINL